MYSYEAIDVEVSSHIIKFQIENIAVVRSITNPPLKKSLRHNASTSTNQTTSKNDLVREVSPFIGDRNAFVNELGVIQSMAHGKY